MDTDMLVFWIVVLSRFFIPLLIPRYPLPGVIAALVIDGVDQTIFQQFTNLNLDGYQGYDKALDIYYLTITYLAVMKNWTNQFAAKVARFLWYYRLVGVTLFELTYTGEGPRYLLLLFPNTFEYFYIWYEAVRLRWNPRKLANRVVIGAAAFIWIFIKLPQEYWIHIAQNDTTDMIKEKIFGLPVDASLAEMWAAKPWVFIVTGLAIIVLVALAIWIFKKLPKADWKLSFEAGVHPDEKITVKDNSPKDNRWWNGKLIDFWNWQVAEKIVLVSLVSIIFSTIMPDVEATTVQLVVAVGSIIFVNSFLSQLMYTEGYFKVNSLVQFLVMMLVNTGIGLAFLWLAPIGSGSINITNTLFFLLLLTLIVVLFDRYRPYYDARFGGSN